MKKLLFLILIVSACKKDVYYYPSKIFFDKNNLQEIIIDDLNFEEIIDSVSNKILKKERLYITLSDKNREIKISPFTYTGGFIKERNGLEINNDSIYILDKRFPKSDMQKFLKLHFDNNSRIEYFSTSPKYAFIKIVLRSNEKGKKLKKLLLEIIKNFESSNIENKENIDLSIMLSLPLDLEFLKIPPPATPIEIID
jgi:hypothetical protein